MIVFDLDGTLIDSFRDLAGAVSTLVQSFGGRPLTDAEIQPLIGDGAPVLVTRALTVAGLDPHPPGALDRFLHIYDERMLDHTVAYDGVHEMLAMLVSRAPLAVLTNKPLAPTLSLLDRLGLRGFFDIVVGGDGPLPRKPDPAALLSMTPHPARLVALVGDSVVDAATAAAAGCPFVLAAYGFGAAGFAGSVPPVPRVARHPRDLVGVLDTLTFEAARMPIVMR